MENPIPLGIYIHMQSGRKYEVTNNGLDSSEYEKGKEPTQTVHFVALEEGEYPIDIIWSRTLHDFKENFCRVTEDDEVDSR